MAATRKWYTEPETFIAVAALIVSVSAVVVGLYEASLQRFHDRAEVWPRLEIGVFTRGDGASVSLENTGIGPAIVESTIVTLDGQPQHNWTDILRKLNDTEPVPPSNYSVTGHGFRPGDHVDMVGMPVVDVPHPFWSAIAHVGVSVCYRSVFDQRWIVESKHLGNGIAWRDVKRCPPQDTSASF
jgi:hypothetical protein